MAYTYQDFVNAANKAGLMGQFSKEDLAITQTNPEYGLSILNLKKDAAKATTAEQRALASEAEQQIRNSYGSFKGTYDSKINDLVEQIGNTGAFSYGKEEQLQDKLDQLSNYGSFNYANQDAYKNLLDRVANQKEFSYDLEADPVWSSLRKSYLREGERASANALEQAAAGSGGIPSTYAVQAAQQAANYYNSQLNDMIPTLEQNAYQKYLNNANMDLSKLGVLQSDRDFSYQDYLTQYNLIQNALSALQSDKAAQQGAYADRLNLLQQQLTNYKEQDSTEYNRFINALNLAYQKEQDAFAKQQYLDALKQQELENQLNQQKYQDAIAQQTLENQLNQQKYQDALKQQELDNAMALYNLLGYATPEVAALLGIEAGIPVTATSTGSGSGGSGGSGGSDTGAEGYDLSYVLSAYPSGVITDETYWNNLVATYGKDVLTANGITFEKPITQKGGVDMNSLKRLGLENIDSKTLNDLVLSGQLKETVGSNGVISFTATGKKIAADGTETGNGNTGTANKRGKKATSVLSRQLNGR